MKQLDTINRKLHEVIAGIECLYDIYHSEFSSDEINLVLLAHSIIDNLLVLKFPKEHELKHGIISKEVALTNLKNNLILLNEKYNNSNQEENYND